MVYFPSCINQSMGTAVRDKEKKSLVEVSVEVLEKAGYEVIFPGGHEQTLLRNSLGKQGLF